MGIASEEKFVEALNQAFHGSVSTSYDLKSQLLNSYQHVMGGMPRAFKSQSSKNAHKHGRKRTRKQPRAAPQELDEPSAVEVNLQETVTG